MKTHINGDMDHVGLIINPRELVKINPFKVIYQGSKDFVEEGQEETFVRFTMDEDGDYTNVNYLPKNIVKRIEDMVANPEVHFHPRDSQTDGP